MSYDLSTHVLDVMEGRPASNVTVFLEVPDGDRFRRIAHGVTDQDGRINKWTYHSYFPDSKQVRLNFQTLDYFQRKGINSVFPYVEVVVDLDDDEHYHIPILLSAGSYTTYRGS